MNTVGSPSRVPPPNLDARLATKVVQSTRVLYCTLPGWRNPDVIRPDSPAVRESLPTSCSWRPCRPTRYHPALPVEQGVPQRCTLCPTLSQVFINDVLKVVEAAGKVVSAGKTSVSGMLFAVDFVGMSGMPKKLQLQIDAAKDFADKWRLSANVIKVCPNGAKRGW